MFMGKNLIRRPLSNFGFSLWTAFVIAIALVIATPIIFILSSTFNGAGDIWQHLVETVLKDYIFHSLWLILGVGFGVVIIGVGTAWLVTMCSFRGSRWLEWLLLLPLAAPAYLLAYAYTDLLDYFGPIQTFLRDLFGWQTIRDYWFPDIRSLPGAILMLVLVLYPYVYLLARVAFLEQSVCTIEASRSLGSNPWHSFFTIALPLARPSIVAGLALALMETLNDFGTVQYFGVSTFTTGIYRTWLGMGERAAAAQLAALLMLFILILIVVERLSRQQAKYYQLGNSNNRVPKYKLGWFRGLGAGIACILPVAFGFFLPAWYLLNLTIENWGETVDRDFGMLVRNSFIVAIATALIAVLVSLFMAYGQRLQPNWTMRGAVRVAAMGYAIPGSVIAVGVLIPLGSFDNSLDRFMQANFGISTGLLFSGTVVSLIFAYLVRFLAVAFSSVESSLNKIPPNLDDAARSLGSGATKTLVKVHAPLMSGGLLTATMLVFVDVMKELPATLVIRPFNFDTLAIRVYQYASDERLIEAAAPALAIVVVGIVPVIFLTWQITSPRNRLGKKS